MKIMLIAAAVALSLVVPANADEVGQPIIGNPGLELTALIECMANELVLMHSYVQVAASISALSGVEITPQLNLVATSYKDLASDSDKRVQSYVVDINSVIPQIVTTTNLAIDEIHDRLQASLDKSMTHMAMALSNPMHGVDDQVVIQRHVIDQSHICEGLAAAIHKEHD